MRVAGIGCKKGASTSEVLAAVNAAVGALSLDALAVAAFKMDEPPVIAAASTLGLRLLAVPQHALEQASARCVTDSAASLAATGVASVSEAAALAAAGSGSRLLVPRIVVGNVTCAIASGKTEA